MKTKKALFVILLVFILVFITSLFIDQQTNGLVFAADNSQANEVIIKPGHIPHGHVPLLTPHKHTVHEISPNPHDHEPLNAHEHTPLNQLQRIVQKLKDNKKHDEYITKRAVLLVEKKYLTIRQINQIGALIDEGICKVEKYLGVSFDELFKEEGGKITYVINKGKFVSHVEGGYNYRERRIPIVYLSFVKDKKAPYLHETVHIFTPDYYSLWLREGFAVYLNEKLGGYVTAQIPSNNIDSYAKKILSSKNKDTLDLVGENGICEFENDKQRTMFYVFSGSFVKYLESKIGTDTFMGIFKAEDTKQAILDLTPKSVTEWKNEWLEKMGARNLKSVIGE